jgi:hypothetical protein
MNRDKMLLSRHAHTVCCFLPSKCANPQKEKGKVKMRTVRCPDMAFLLSKIERSNNQREMQVMQVTQEGDIHVQ